MTDKIEDGGTVYPFAATDQINWSMQAQGMTLRDWFAGQALAGWLASFGENDRHPVEKGAPRITAAYAWAMADAMLAVRKAKP